MAEAGREVVQSGEVLKVAAVTSAQDVTQITAEMICARPRAVAAAGEHLGNDVRFADVALGKVLDGHARSPCLPRLNHPVWFRLCRLRALRCLVVHNFMLAVLAYSSERPCVPGFDAPK